MDFFRSLWTRLSSSARAGSYRELADALAASESRYRHLIENAPDIIYRTDASGNFAFVNAMAEVIIGRPQAELLGHNYLDLIHPADRDAMRRLYGLQWVRKTPTTYAEFRVSTASGRLVWIGQNVQLVMDGGHRVGFQAVARDITDRKLAEEALADLQQRTESILNSAAEGIVSVDRNGQLVMVNPTAAQLTGYSIEQMHGQSAHSLLHHSHADGSPYPASECTISRALTTGNLSRRQTDVFWRRDGSSFQVEYTIVPIRQGERTTGAVLTFHDISDRVAVERMKDEFISVVSHELRTPLTSIRASLGLLQAGLLDLDAKRRQRMIDLAVGNADRLITLVNDIVDVQRLTRHDVRIDRQPVEVRTVVQRCMESVRGQAESARVHVVESVESGLVLGEPGRLVQALTNLVENAIKFSPADSSVDVTVRFVDDAAVFSVRDYGHGIPDQKVDSLFARFEQLDASDSRAKGGTGLGLSIARMIVEVHGGDIWVESNVGEGSTFYFTIPCSLAPAIRSVAS